MIPELEIQHGGTEEVERLQENVKKFAKPLEDNPLLDGRLIENATQRGAATPGLGVGVNHIEHGLGRNLRGWVITRLYGPPPANPNIYDTQATNPTPGQTLELVSAQICNVDLWVF